MEKRRKSKRGKTGAVTHIHALVSPSVAASVVLVSPAPIVVELVACSFLPSPPLALPVEKADEWTVTIALERLVRRRPTIALGSVPRGGRGKKQKKQVRVCKRAEREHSVLQRRGMVCFYEEIKQVWGLYRDGQ